MPALDHPLLLTAIGIAVFALIALGFVVREALYRRVAWGGALWFVMTLGYLYTGHLPMLLGRMPEGPIARAAVQAYDTLWWLVLAWLFVQVANTLLWRVLFPSAQAGGRKLIADLMSGFVYLGAFLAILAFTFDQDISGVLATSGVVAIVLGLALQSSLGEIVSGLFMSVEAPYRAGDWLTLDDRIEGQVMETNWRATRLKTRTGDYLIVPNSTIAKANIVNHYFPDRSHTAQVSITVDPRAAPDRVMTVVKNAVLASARARRNPPPQVLIVALAPTGIEYRVAYEVDDFAEAHLARSEVSERIWRTLFWAGIRPTDAPVPAPATAHSEPERVAALDRALTRVGLFAPLSGAERAALATSFRMRSLGAGDTLVKQGDGGDTMFLISEGVLAVLHGDGQGGSTEIVRLGPGEYVGEMSLLTGAPRSASVRAVTDSCVHELSKADLAPIMAARPALAIELGRVLATRQESLEQAIRRDDGSGDGAESYAARIASWISAFFRA